MCVCVFEFYFIFKLYITVLVLPNIKMNPPQVYMYQMAKQGRLTAVLAQESPITDICK